MLKSIGDWYRIQDPEPNDEVLRMRREASEALLSHFVRAQISTFLSLISCALEGLLGKQDGSEVPMSVLDEMAKAQPSLNRELIAETLDPRLCVAVALSEFIGREPANANEKKRVLLAVSAIASALRFRRIGSGATSARLASQLLGRSEEVITAADLKRRQRAAQPLRRLDNLQASTESPQILQSVKTVVKSLYDEMLRDREELQALWWLFGGSSFLTGKRFSDLSPGTAALMAGAELTTLVNPPAAIGLIAIARRAVKEKGEESMPFATLMSDVSADTMALAAPDSSFGLSIKGNPLLFPVSRFVLFSVDAGRPADMAYAAGLREVPVTVAQIAEQFASEKALLSLITEA